MAFAATARAQEGVLFSDKFEGPDDLVTNEYAYWHPKSYKSVNSLNWEMTSGSLFVSSGVAWSGTPDEVKPDPSSGNGTNSSVFRLVTKKDDFGDVEVALSLYNMGVFGTRRNPATGWDGVHIFLRYQNPRELYYASVNRRDNTVIIKKKVSGGPSNDGTYYNLSASGAYKVPYNAWQKIKATVKNNPDGSVSIRLYAGDKLLASAKDNGAVGGAPIKAPGKVGIRADNCEFKFDDFTVSSLSDK